MKRVFRSRVGRVLRVREIAERAARGEWASAELDARRAEDGADARRADVDRARRELAGIQDAGTLSGADVVLADRVALRLGEALRRARARAAERRAAADGRRAAWTLTRRDLRALERLDERQRERHAEDVRRAEAAESDEWAASQRRPPGPPRD